MTQYIFLTRYLDKFFIQRNKASSMRKQKDLNRLQTHIQDDFLDVD